MSSTSAPSVDDDMVLFFAESTPVYFIGPGTEKRPREAYFPQPGFVCKVKWSDPKFKRDWVKDGYVWRADGSRKKLKYQEGFVFKYYFKLRIGSGEGPEAFTKAFNKRAFEHPDYSDVILVIYSGDVSVVNEKYYHGNAKTKEKMEKPFFPTVPSVLIESKERKQEPPAKVHNDIVKAAPQDMQIQATEATREIEQVRNCQKAARRADMISQDTQYNAFLLGIEADFLDGFQLAPDIAIVAIHKGKKPIRFLIRCSSKLLFLRILLCID